YVKFVTVTIVSLAIAESALFVGVRIFGVPDLFAKIFSAPLIVVWNFLAYRYWAFRSVRVETMVPMRTAS
ncbi:MAG: GtrA family protein, partial [Phycisphaerales bacterium]|nr:GtrA family protein [Phycisphaerales bacterium]